MKGLFFRTVITALGFGSLYLSSGESARADDWGCQVILCLSNPGGPTEFAECRPSIQKLWRWLAKGHSFPTCSGVGFQSSRPRYEPLYCNEGYRLTTGYGSHGRDAICVSTSTQVVDNRLCQRDGEGGRGGYDPLISARWDRDGSRVQCIGYTTARPLVREKPRYIDVTIDGVGKRRVWF